MSSFMRKYGVETTIEFPVPKLDDTDFAATGDWTPAAADIKISKDGGNVANCSNTAAAVGGTGSVLWALTLTATEMQAARVTLQIVDAALENQAITIETYGNASAQHAFDLDTATQDVNAIQISGSATAADNLEVVYDGVEGFAAAYAGPRGPGVYLNDAAGNTNTVNGVDGTWANPVSTIAAAKTIADSLSVDRIYLVNDSVITLAATMEDYEFVGIGEMAANTIDLGSQDVDNSYFENVLISGAQGGTGRFQAKDCVLSAITSMEITALACLLASGTLTLRNDCAFDSCFSAVAGGGSPILDINSVADVNVYFRHYSGGLQVNNAVSTTIMSYEADGQIIIGATCTSLTIHVRGNCTITDNGTTTSLTQDAAMNRTNVNAEMDTAWTTQLADSVPADGTISTREQALYAMLQALTEFSISGTTITVKKVDGSTTLMTFTLDDATNPTSRTRAT